MLEQEIWQVYRDQGLTVLAIDMQEPPILAANWAEANGISYPILSSPDWSLLYLFGFGSIPHNAIIGRDGILRYSTYGFDFNAIRDLIEELLIENTATRPLAWGDLKTLYD